MPPSRVVAVEVPPFDLDLYDRLVALARAGQTIDYTTLFGSLGRARAIAGRELRPIAESEHGQGRPLLTVIVVGAHNGLPGLEFFGWIKRHDEGTMACACGRRLRRTAEKKADLVSRLQADVYSSWGSTRGR